MAQPIARIYRPGKTAMQSGRAKTKEWVLDFGADATRKPDPLMGWTASGNTLDQVELSFDTKEEAVAFAKARGWAFQVIEGRKPKRIVKTYAENFSPSRKQPWTH